MSFPCSKTDIFNMLERLCANHCQFSEFMQTMLLLSALPQKWDHLASVYIQDVKAIMTSLHSHSVLGRVIVESLTKSFN